MKKTLLLALLLFALPACRQLASTEVGLRFWLLPPPLGGVSDHILRPGETIIDIPILTQLYTFDTKVNDVSFGIKQAKVGSERDFVQTRAKDGNEVALAVTVSYRIYDTPETLVRLVHEVGTSEEAVQEIVISAARSDIRTAMNTLQTSEFIIEKSRYAAVDQVKETLNTRLSKYGIEVLRVNLDDYEFRRVKPDGSIDTSYEERLKFIQETREEIERERARIETVKAKKEQEFNEAQAGVNKLLEEAKGYEAQAHIRADSYLSARKNKAEGVLSRGKAEAEGIVEKVQALEGKGGEELLKLEIAKELRKAQPKFVIVSSEKGGGASELRLNKVDENELLRQFGLTEGLIDKQKNKQGEKDQ